LNDQPVQWTDTKNEQKLKVFGSQKLMGPRIIAILQALPGDINPL